MCLLLSCNLGESRGYGLCSSILQSLDPISRVSDRTGLCWNKVTVFKSSWGSSSVQPGLIPHGKGKLHGMPGPSKAMVSGFFLPQNAFFSLPQNLSGVWQPMQTSVVTTLLTENVKLNTQLELSQTGPVLPCHDQRHSLLISCPWVIPCQLPLFCDNGVPL